MFQQFAKQSLIVVVASLALGVSLAPLSATAATFNGSQVNGPASVYDSRPNNLWTSAVYPNPAYQFGSYCPWVTAGLNAQGFTAANGWTVNWLPMTGTMQLENYYAWVTNQPTETIGGNNYGGGGPTIDWGGADIRVLYTPGAGDPSGASVDWLQAIYTNSPIGGLGANGFNAGGGYYEYLDNAGTYGTNPDYDNNPPDPTSSTEFVDIPSRGGAPYTSILWEAQVYVDTFNAGTKTINIYGGGINWGFQYTASPEPSTIVLLATGALGLLAFVWRRRTA